MEKIQVDLVVSRHKALVETLKEVAVGFDLSNAEVKEHVEEKDVTGKIIIGVLPLRLASKARRFFELSLAVPADMRGKELTKDELKKYMIGIQEYIVATPGSITVEIMGDDLSWVSGILKKEGNIVRGVTIIRKDMLGEYKDTL